MNTFDIPDEDLAIAFGRQIAGERKKAGLSQTALAERLGITLKSVSRYETAQREPTVTMARAIARALGVPLSDMLLWAEDRARSGMESGAEPGQPSNSPAPSAGAAGSQA